MKKSLLFIIAFLSQIGLFAQACSDLIISEYAEGSNNNKALELYNPTASPIALNGNYRLVRYNNGTGAIAGEANSQAMINLGNHVINSHDVFVIVIDKRDASQPCPGNECAVDLDLQALADTFLCPDYNVSYSMYFNGNDAVSLQKFDGSNWNYIDIFGMIGDPAMVSGQAWSDQFPYDGSVGAWWTKDQTLVRRPSVTQGVTVNPTPYFNVTLEYDSLPNETWTGLGSHTCDCYVAQNVNDDFSTTQTSVYPNPTSNGHLFIQANESIISVELMNLLGEKLAFETSALNSRLVQVHTASQAPGIYFVRVNYHNNRSSVHRVTIR